MTVVLLPSAAARPIRVRPAALPSRRRQQRPVAASSSADDGLRCSGQYGVIPPINGVQMLAPRARSPKTRPVVSRLPTPRHARRLWYDGGAGRDQSQFLLNASGAQPPRHPHRSVVQRRNEAFLAIKKLNFGGKRSARSANLASRRALWPRCHRRHRRPLGTSLSREAVTAHSAAQQHLATSCRAPPPPGRRTTKP